VRDYGKVHSTFWSSQTIAALSDDGKLLALYLMTCGHGTIAGVFRLPDGYISEDLGATWTAERLGGAFTDLEKNEFAKRCPTSKWVWIIKHLDWNRPENPNQRKAVTKIALSVPSQCSWHGDFVKASASIIGLPSTVEEPLPNPSETVTGTVVSLFGNQKQEQEQEQKQEQEQDKEPSASSAAKPPPCPHQEILALFGKHLPMLPQPQPERWGGNRAKHLSARWKWLFLTSKRNGERYAKTTAEGLDWFARFFGYVATSEFLTGRDGKWTACDLGWLVEEEHMAKVVQGNYHPKGQHA
jgi:hypothetical protein